VYNISFPSSTWPTMPMLVVTPFSSTAGDFTAIVTGLSFNGGAASFTVATFNGGVATDVGFMFVAAAT
jgi:hypothetical protein